MSFINKKNALTLALVAGLGLAANASAYTLTTNGNAAPVLVATADIIDATTNIGINEAFTVSLTSGDFILGRTTGFTIRYTLSNGATFGEVVGTDDLAIGSAAPGWTPTVAAGGGLGDNFIVINLNPPSPTTTLTVGPLLTINAATSVVSPGTTGQVLDDVDPLQTAGAQIVANVQFVDPVTASAIMPAQSLVILQSGDPVVLDCDAQDGDIAKRIDVGVTATQGSKTFFSSTGVISGADEGLINLGSIDATVATGFTSFSFLSTDEFTTVVNGDFSAFTPPTATRGVFLSQNIDCSTRDVVGTVNNANGTVTFTYDGAAVAITGTGFTAFVCAQVPAGNTTVIDASAVSEITTFTRGDVSSNGASCPLLPLRFNGSVVEVYHLNPAGNTQAQSFLRVINPSDSAGIVTIVGIDDNGVDGDSSITFTLGARQSMQLNSEDLENGNAAKGLTGGFGNGAGKWRAVVTGEFSGLRVQGLNRNTTDGTVTNLTDADGQGEQQFNKLFDDGSL